MSKNRKKKFLDEVTTALIYGYLGGGVGSVLKIYNKKR